MAENIPPVVEEGSDFWMKTLKAGAKFATNDKVMATGKFIGKMNYLRFTNPMWYVGIEAFNSVRDALVVDAVTGKKSTPMDVAKDAVGMAGFGYVMDMAMTKGGQALARSKYGSELAGGAVDALLGKITKGGYAPTEEMFTVGDMVAKSMQKFIKPVDLGPLKFGAVGMAAGLLYAGLNNKKDGVRGTAFDMISGAGLVMLGHEMYHHLSKKDEEEMEYKPTAKDFVKKSIAKVKETESGYLGFEAFKEVLGTEHGQNMKKALTGLMHNTEEGKYFKEFHEAIKEGDWTSIVGMARDHETFTKNLDGFHTKLMGYFASDNGLADDRGLVNEAVNAYKTYGKDFSDAVVRDVSKVIAGHVGGIKKSFQEGQKVYLQHQETIRTMLRRAGFSEGDVNTLHEGMTEGITKSIKKLDDITSKEVVDGPEMKDVTEKAVDTKETEVKAEPKDVKKQSEDIAHNKDKNDTTTVKDVNRVDGLTEHEISQKAIASQRRITGWKEKAKVVGALGLGAFAVATALDISERLDHKTNTSKQVNEEKHNKQKQAHQQRMDQWKQSYGYINMGDMVHQMFQDRIGHHQMGNAKFAPNQYSIQGQTYTI